MNLRHLHSWDVTPAEAIALQRELAPLVVTEGDPQGVKRIAGVDVGFEEGGKVTRAAVVVLDFPGLTLLESAVARCPTVFPYVPGLLSFREAPAALEALARLTVPPDTILCDGQGIAHPRRFGLASHLGVLTDLPTIGVAKTRYIGTFSAPNRPRGSWTPLLDSGEQIGAVLRTRSGVSPLFVSIGHRIDLDSAIRFVLTCAPRFRLPETTRLAHKLASG